MKIKITIFTIILIISGCKIADVAQLKSNKSQTKPDNGKVYTQDLANTTGVVIEIPKLAQLSPDELNQELGQPKREWSLGSVGVARSYNINNGEAELTVMVNNNRVIELDLKLNELRESSDDLLKAGGFDLKGQKADWENAISKEYKNRSFNKIRFESIESTMSPPDQKWEDIEARVVR